MITRSQSPKSLRNAWKELLSLVTEHGEDLDEEIREVRGVMEHFKIEPEDIHELSIHGLAETLAEMRKVFFSNDQNRFGHSYRSCWRGPLGRDDLTDVIGLLREQPSTKRALLTFVDQTGSRVPCINSIHFLIRHGKLDITYFARGQDVYLKFCADAICVNDFADIVSDALEIETGTVTGILSSAHIYHKDFSKIEAILKKQ